jgi:hypothetical protein
LLKINVLGDMGVAAEPGLKEYKLSIVRRENFEHLGGDEALRAFNW